MKVKRTNNQIKSAQEFLRYFEDKEKEMFSEIAAALKKELEPAMIHVHVRTNEKEIVLTDISTGKICKVKVT
jgi:hypothetical protein